jgi:hypothetical protein
MFDPVFIIYQMIAMQCFYYLAMGTLWGLCHVIFDTPVSLDHFFTAKYINFVSISGWIEVSCTLIMAIIGYAYIYVLIILSLYYSIK